MQSAIRCVDFSQGIRAPERPRTYTHELRDAAVALASWGDPTSSDDASTAALTTKSRPANLATYGIDSTSTLNSRVCYALNV